MTVARNRRIIAAYSTTIRAKQAQGCYSAVRSPHVIPDRVEP